MFFATNVANRADIWNNDAVTNNAVNMDTNTAPWKITDAHGIPTLFFPHGQVQNGNETLTKGTNFLEIDQTLASHSLSNAMFMVVSYGNGNQLNQNLWQFTNSSGLYFTTSTQPSVQYTNPTCMVCVSRSTTNIFPALNKAIYWQITSTVGTIIGMNYNWESNGAVSGAALLGGNLGGRRANAPFGGNVYRALGYYTNAFTVPMALQMVSYLAQEHGVVTNFTRSVVCRGDSITAGFRALNHESWPRQIYQQCPELLVYNYGVGGAKIGTNGDAGNFLYPNDPHAFDALFRPWMRNFLFVKAGVNDIDLDLVGGAVTWLRMTNHIQNMLAVRSWNVAVGTIANNNLQPAAISNYNALLRTSRPADWLGVADAGFGSPHDRRLYDPTDTAYFSTDLLHLNSGGYRAHKEHFMQFVNVHRRQSAFW